MMLLRHGSPLKHYVSECYQRAGNGGALRIESLEYFRQLISAKLQVPESALGDIHDEFQRFDFDGDPRMRKVGKLKLKATLFP